MANNSIKIGITQGDINGVGYEVILKTFESEEMQSLCTPIIYGSPKVATYHKKAFDNQTSFNIVESASGAKHGKLNMVNCFGEEEHKIEYGEATENAGKAALISLKCALKDLKEGNIDALVTAPLNDSMIKEDGDGNRFHGQKNYIDFTVGENRNSLNVLISSNLRIAIVTGNMPISQVASNITKELIAEKLVMLHNMLKRDFFIDNPRIAVMSLNPQLDLENEESEEAKTIVPVIDELFKRGVRCFGPYTSDNHFGNENYKNFDATLAMYYDQGMTAFKSLTMNEGLVYTAGIPVIVTAPIHDTEYNIAGKGCADESSFRHAVYTAIDAVRNRKQFDFERRNPLKKQYFEKRDDSDKLKLDQVDD